MSGFGHDVRMDWIRVGRQLRGIRLHGNLRQQDVADRARVSRWVVARVERGAVEDLSIRAIEAVVRALEAEVATRVRWRGAEIDRVTGIGHSAMHEVVACTLRANGWDLIPELSFSVWGERGVIDIVAWHGATRTLLVIELKTEIVDVQATIGTVDRYRRLAASLVRERGWVPDRVATWVAVADSSANRQRLADHVTVLRAAFPNDGRTVRRWLRRPVGDLNALSFISADAIRERTAARGSRRRVFVGRAVPKARG
jgi:transcriptional regulator with XRE-family HTH domain